MNLNDILSALAEQGVKVDDIATEHKKQIEDYIKGKDSTAQDKPSTGEGAKPTK